MAKNIYCYLINIKMQTPKVTSCKAKFEAIYTGTRKENKSLPSGESFTVDDYEAAGFKGFDNKNRSKKEIRDWATETKALAQKSIFCHTAEILIKPAAYIVSAISENRDLDKWLFIGERFLSTFGGMFRNNIYGRKDDNLGAEKFAAEKFGDKATYSLGRLNNFIQTKLKFVFPVMGIFNKDLANSLDWAITDSMNTAWWRNMSINSGFYSGIAQEFINKMKGEMPIDSQDSPPKENHPSLKYMFKTVKSHYNEALKDWGDYRQSEKSENKKQSLISFARNMDKATSIMMPLLSIPATFLGDFMRPIARALDLPAPIRSVARMLSIADRAILGLNYIPRFLIPERISENEEGNKSLFRFSNLYIASLIGDMSDLPLIFFENKIKESNKSIQASVAFLRAIKDPIFNIAWSQKRVSASNRALKKLEDKNTNLN